MLTSPDNILMALGYGLVYPEGFFERLTSVPTALGSRIDSLMVSLKAIDDALTAAPLDSMAVKIDKLEVSYSQHMALLKQEASRILEEISVLTMIPIIYDRYARSTPTVAKANPKYTFVSYY